MTRFLFVVPPLTGHVNPLLGVAAELRSRGHRVAWAGPHPVVAELETERDVYAAGDGDQFAVDKRPGGLRGFAALRFLWESYLIPLADAMVEGVEAAVRDFSPDALVVDQQALAGAVVAARTGLPWATSASTSSELTDPLGSLSKVAEWIEDLQDGLRLRHGLEPGTGQDLRFSPRMVVVFSTEALAGPPAVPVAGELHYVGPSLAGRCERDAAAVSGLRGMIWDRGVDWGRFDPAKPLVLVTLGTANADVSGRFLGECARALGDLADQVQGVVADPAGMLAGSAPPHVLVPRRIPQLALIRRAALVVCHGGHNTVCESLGFGVPLVVAPIRDDQPVLAQQVVDAGVGRRLRFDRASAADVGEAVLHVLGEPEYARQAQRLQESFERAGGASAAAGHLETLTADG
ncbi:MGT family glycosyltransferase [Saccharopolyspora erythraea NRRL 2338]|uniref:UDP-glucuronosyltransferase n=2 Tax=Saccharopolyspora erythraea TaxID=1836 RepID=A4FC71_SACEN|nr:glycosyltransferase [Saccharopolyspora erythraea]EQD84485.1 UDP-glucuronosyltransferase [Saccharopolyspora erythraea D]PFG95407.1 MGT family glycosyltransferase [Saccharopolyspora erythraea NRRL 2338]QRK92046.1 glycosyltransferase family 1 protein [Saccharopolyspora erythraea]CAM01646.1 UDP-glucuronosyltransferase [Saccharopolyspora erythraea NRRL 2338]